MHLLSTLVDSIMKAQMVFFFQIQADNFGNA